MALWLNEVDVRSVLSMPDLIDAMQTALADFSAGRVHQPVRTVIDVEPNRSFFATMPAHAPGIPALGAKLVTVFGANPAQGLPSHLATILLLDANTGALLAILDGRYITEARTAAVSAVAALLLTRPDARTLTLIGSGVQARSHLDALTRVRQFHEVRCWSPTPAHLATFVSDTRTCDIRAAESAESAVRGADVIVLATSSPEPVIRNEWVQDGATIIAVGACRPNQREMPAELVARARLIVDSKAAAMQESGDVLLPIRDGLFTADYIAAELGEVIAKRRPGRTSDQEVVVFKSLGLAVEDVVAAHLVYARAIESGRGAELA